MNEELTKRTDEVLLNMLRAIDGSMSYADEDTCKAVDNFTCLYKLRQKDCETELQRESDCKKLELETKKFENGVEQEQIQRKAAKSQLWLQAIGLGLSYTFRSFVASSCLYMDATGRVIGSALGKATLGKWVEKTEKL